MFLVKDGFCLLTHWPYIQFRSIWELKKMLCALTVQIPGDLVWNLEISVLELPCFYFKVFWGFSQCYNPIRTQHPGVVFFDLCTPKYVRV